MRKGRFLTWKFTPAECAFLLTILLGGCAFWTFAFYRALRWIVSLF